MRRYPSPLDECGSRGSQSIASSPSSLCRRMRDVWRSGEQKGLQSLPCALLTLACFLRARSVDLSRSRGRTTPRPRVRGVAGPKWRATPQNGAKPKRRALGSDVSVRSVSAERSRPCKRRSRAELRSELIRARTPTSASMRELPQAPRRRGLGSFASPSSSLGLSSSTHRGFDASAAENREGHPNVTVLACERCRRTYRSSSSKITASH